MNMISFFNQTNPDLDELKEFFEKVFAEFDPEDVENFKDDDHQSLEEWFDMNSLRNYLVEGALIEAREKQTLVGAIFVGKQHLLSWPDGKKAEIFILGVEPTIRGQGLGKKLVSMAEQSAKEFGAQSIIVNTHISLETVQRFYENLGFVRIGLLNNYFDNGDAVFFKKEL